MKSTKLLAVATALGLGLLPLRGQTTAASVPVALSPGASEVVRLEQSGLGEEVILAYVRNSQTAFDLGADGILYLKDVGVTSPVIRSMLDRDAALRGQAPAAEAPPPVPTPQPVVAPAAQAVPVAAPAPVYVSSPPPAVSYFYSDLSPHGAWIELAGVGWCWQPRAVIVQSGWRPYCDGGHWVWTDAGWYWQSDYAWGWAPFHYGRWLHHARSGWVWVPDTVWGPAWVTWRVADDHCGWAPLPPRADFDLGLGFRFNGVRVGLNFDFGLGPDVFTFVSINDFGGRDYSHRRLPPTEVVRIYNRTTVVNNYVVNHAVINRGIAVERVAAATRQPIQRVAIRDLPAGAPHPSNAHGAGNAELAVYRPQLAAPARPISIVAQKVDDRHPIAHRTATPSANGNPRPAPAPGGAPPNPASGSRPAVAQNSAPASRPAPDRVDSNLAPSRTPARPAVQNAPSAPIHPVGTTTARPAANDPFSTTTARPTDQVKPASRGQEVYHRDSGPTLGAPSPPKTTTTASAPNQNSRQYDPKTTRQDTDTRPASPQGPKVGK